MAQIKTNLQYGVTGSLQTANVAIDAIGLAQMATGTDGNVITYDASGNPAVVSTGTSGHFLKSQGAGSVPVFAAAAGFDASSITGQTDYGNIPPATGDSIAFYDTSASALREITLANLGNTPAFSRFDNAALSIDSSTWTKLELDSGHFDTHSVFDATNERFVVPANCGGTYWFSYSASIDNIYAGKYILANLYKNGSSWNNSFSIIRGNNNHSAQAPAFVRGSVIGELAATDYIELWIWHNHGSAYNTNAYATTLQGFRITGR